MAPKEKGSVYWITGLSGAGKTTIGTMLYEKIREQKPNVLIIDGDTGRVTYNDQIGYDLQSRKEGAFRNGRVCRMIAEQGIDVICCTISMFDEVRQWNRENIENYVEIYLEVPMEVLVQRDQKKLYSEVNAGKRKNVAGVDMQMEFPKNPDIHIINDGSHTPEEVLVQILNEGGIC